VKKIPNIHPGEILEEEFLKVKKYLVKWS